MPMFVCCLPVPLSDMDEIIHISSTHSQSLNRLCPTGRFLAGVTQGVRVVIRSLPTMAVHAKFSAVDRVEELSWNSTGTLILAAVESQGIVHVWSVLDSNWTCRIDVGSAGMRTAFFHPTSPVHFFVVCDFGLRLKLFGVEDIETAARSLKGIYVLPCLSHDKSRACFITDRSTIGVADLKSSDSKFEIVQSLQLYDLNVTPSHLVWTGDDRCIIALESPLSNNLSVYNLAGKSVRVVPLSHPSERVSLGARTVEHNRTILALGFFDQVVRIYNIRTGLEQLASIPLFSQSQVTIVNGVPAVWRETLGGDASTRDRNLFQLGGANAQGFPVEYREAFGEDTCDPSVKSYVLPSSDTITQLDIPSPPRGGVCKMRISPDGSWLAAQTDEKASIVFLIDTSKLRVSSILVHRQPVSDFSWNPVLRGSSSELAITTGDPRVYLWNPSGCHRTLQLKDTSFRPSQVYWGPEGSDMVIQNGDHVCVACMTSATGPTGA